MIYAVVGLMLVISFMMKGCFVQEPYVTSVVCVVVFFLWYGFHIAVLLAFFLDIFWLNSGENA